MARMLLVVDGYPVSPGCFLQVFFQNCYRLYTRRGATVGSKLKTTISLIPNDIPKVACPQYLEQSALQLEEALKRLRSFTVGVLTRRITLL